MPLDTIESHPINSTVPLIKNSTRASRPSQSLHIPEERFRRVQQSWPLPSSDSTRVSSMNGFWQDVVSHGATGLFSESDIDPASPDLCHEPQKGLVWGFDEECRNRSIKDCCIRTSRFNRADPSASLHTLLQTDNPGELPEHSIMPPAKVLDISIDLFFRLFHVIQPFVHRPSFDVVRTPSLLLFSMCL